MDKISNWTKSTMDKIHKNKITNWTKSRIKKIQKIWTKSQIGLNLKLDKIQDGLNPKSTQLQKQKKSGLIVYSWLAYKHQ